MPTYEYECRKCGHTLEAVQSFNDKPLTKCPACKKKGLFKVVSGGLGFFMENRTLGVVADKNGSQYSDDFKQHLKEKHKTKKREGKLPKGMTRVEQPTVEEKPAVPFFKRNQTVSDAKLAKATPQQKKNYIETGKLDG